MFEEYLTSVPWLNHKVFNNSILDYILTFLSFFLIWAALSIFFRYGLMRLKKYIGHRYPQAQGVIYELIRSIYPFVFPVIAFHFTIQRLELNARFAKYVEALALAVGIFQLTVLLSTLISFFIMRLSFGREQNDLSVRNVRMNLKVLVGTALWVAASLFFLSNLGINITTFITGLGIGGIAIALAAQNILGDLFSSFVIAIDKPFEVGDAIQMETYNGTVEYIGLKTTRIRSISGEIIVVPNAELTKARIRNYKRMQNRRIAFNTAVALDTTPQNLSEIPNIIKSLITSQKDTRFDRSHLLTIANGEFGFETVYFVTTPDFLRYADIQQTFNIQLITEFTKRGIKFSSPPPSAPASK